jgi:hypothetical protein
MITHRSKSFITFGGPAMPESPEQSRLTRSDSIRCFKCGTYARADVEACPSCGYVFAPRTMAATELTVPIAPAKPPTLKLPAEDTAKLRFLPNASLILQFLPSGACLSLTLEHPMILGRGTSADPDKILDLSAFQGLLYGVSRQHCKFERRGDRLFVTDLGSTNGTYYNDKRLAPFVDQVVSHGDRLIIGALHVILRFSRRE